MNQAPDGISELAYRRMSDLIRSACGISLSPAKRTMIETRLRKRARLLGMASLSAYCDYVHSRAGRNEELPRLIDAVTTHKTDFFREPAHFDYLVEQALPELERLDGAAIRRPLRVWSSACSTGEEPYTLAMVLTDYAAAASQGCWFLIEGTDISSAVLETARAAVYPDAAVEPVPAEFRRLYLLRSKDPGKARVRIAPEVRAAVGFRQVNLMEDDYGFAEPLDVVFCRNVMIYFDRPQQQRILSRIIRTLRTGGYLFMGHSESLNGLDLTLEQVAPTVYRRPDV
jgi:chemotaxis protein methyltransferase CheR